MRQMLVALSFVIAVACAASDAQACPCEVLDADGELSEAQFVKLPRLSLVDGGTIDLAGGNGDAVAVLFWATWCPGCRQELAEADRFVSMFRKKNVMLVGVSLDFDPAALDRYLSKNPLGFPISLISFDAVNEFKRVRALPKLVIVRKRDGKVLSVSNPTGLDDVKIVLDKIALQSGN